MGGRDEWLSVVAGQRLRHRHIRRPKLRIIVIASACVYECKGAAHSWCR